MEFEDWYESEYPLYKAGRGLWNVHKTASKIAWDKQQKRIDYLWSKSWIDETTILEVIERLENYPTCMSCYLKVEEFKAAADIKHKFIEILKKELL